MTASELSQDPESLLPAGSRCSCPCRSLDWILGLGLCALGAAFLWFVLCSPWRVLARPLETLETPPAALTAGEGAGAQMLPVSYLTNNRHMKWEKNPDLDGVVFSPNFNYHEAFRKLEVKVGGLYFIYAQLAVRCTLSKCKNATTITLTVHQQSGTGYESVALTVSQHLSLKSEESESKFSAALRPLKKGDCLYVDLKVEVDHKQVNNDDWQLEQASKKDSFFGLFRLSGSSEPAAQQLGA